MEAKQHVTGKTQAQAPQFFVGGRIIKKGTANTPQVFVDDINSKVVVSGNCDSMDKSVLLEILDFLDDYIQKHQGINMELTLYTLNTSAVKGMLNMLKMMRQYHAKGYAVNISWKVQYEDEDLLDIAMEITDLYGFGGLDVHMAA